MLIGPSERVLFQGDSITDCGRPRDGNDWHLGLGYPQLVAAMSGHRYPGLKTAFINRGIGGDRVPSLQARWQEDCIDLQPDWVSILIGINDACQAATEGEPNSAKTYETGYRDILTQVRDKTTARLIILEPFLLHTEHPYDFISPIHEIRFTLDPMIAAARKLAGEFEAVYVPLDNLYQEASKDVDPAHWAEDAIHPTLAGHGLIAEAWIKAVSSNADCGMRSAE
ncbi:MAG: SGNH/GDSL hydrolase family protein [Planctomycetota bacterium]|jgi:lysophospholipase L1-like esterase